MARTSEAAVQAICKVKGSVSLTPFIEAANAVVTQHCTDDDLTAETLELVERWLSAHMYKQREMQLQSERAGPVGRSFQSKVDLGFDNTTYGQMAMRLDWSGALAKLNEASKKGGQPSVSISWLGTESEES